MFNYKILCPSSVRVPSRSPLHHFIPHRTEVKNPNAVLWCIARGPCEGWGSRALYSAESPNLQGIFVCGVLGVGYIYYLSSKFKPPETRTVLYVRRGCLCQRISVAYFLLLKFSLTTCVLTLIRCRKQTACAVVQHNKKINIQSPRGNSVGDRKVTIAVNHYKKTVLLASTLL